MTMIKKYLAPLCIAATFASCQQVIDGKLTAMANVVNKSCPMQVDKETRLDNVMAMPGKTVQYNYTLVNYKVADIDTNKLKGALMPGMVQTLKTAPDLKYMRDNKVKMAYYYKDMTGAYIMRIVLTPGES